MSGRPCGRATGHGEGLDLWFGGHFCARRLEEPFVAADSVSPDRSWSCTGMSVALASRSLFTIAPFPRRSSGCRPGTRRVVGRDTKGRPGTGSIVSSEGGWDARSTS